MYDDAVMKAFFSEYRSVTFQCNSSVSSSIQFSKINSYLEKDPTMAPQQQDPLPKTSAEQIMEPERPETRASPVSSLGGASMDSSSPLTNEASSENNQSYDMRHSQMHDPSSEDSGSMTNVLEYQDHLQSPLQQLQCSLGKDGMLGQKLHLGEYPSVGGNVSNGSCVEVAPADPSYDAYFSRCHICTFATKSKEEYDMHMSTHFLHKCSYCDYTSRTEGRLKAHMNNYHSKTPPDNWAGSRHSRKDVTGSSQPMNDTLNSNGKNRVYKCKQCDFVAYQKNEFWKHNKIHIKAEKQLQCEKCDFVTEYKHHYEYHIRNHFGSKPFKCSKCNYSCVNKSMLNSHSKSHSNVYQYRCANCSYATKYCHSLKLHLRKYEHRPATVLNVDGTPNPLPIIDIYGTRRGPRTKKRKIQDELHENNSGSSIAAGQQPMGYPPAVSFLNSGIHAMFPAHFLNGYPNVYMNAPQPADSPAVYPLAVPHVRMQHDAALKCSFCLFTTDQYEAYQQHIIKHAVENKDLIATMGMTPESLHFQEPQMFNSHLQRRVEPAARSRAENLNFQDSSNQRPNELEYESKGIKEENGLNSNTFKIASPRSDSRQEMSPVGTNASDTLSQHENQERCSSEERERSVIVTQKISPSQSGETRMENNKACSDDKNEHTPLDLSGSKSVDSASDTEKSEGNIGKRSPTLKCSSSPDVDANMSSAIPRNRRKGKAFKIDHYMQYEDQSETINNETEHINYPEHIKNLQHLKDVNSFCFGQSIQRPLQAVSDKLGRMSPAASVPFEVNSASVSSDIQLQNQSQSSPLNQKKYHGQSLPSATAKNSSAVTTANSQHTKEVTNDIVTESTPLPKSEVNVEQVYVSKKQPNVFKCHHCLLTFEDSVMHSLHMGFHGYGNPFTCNMCGYETDDRVDFFSHVQRAAHL